jgi:drug/metabolite transporter (DMT)-like permease
MKSTRNLLIIAALLQITWGLVPSASKVVIGEIPVELYIAIRWTISGALFALFLFATQGWRRLSLKAFAAVAVLGILGYGVASFGTLYGLKIGGVTNFSLMSALGPIITSGVAIALLKERPARLFFFALPLCVVGLLFLVFGKYEISSFGIVATSVASIVGGYILEAIVFISSKKFKAGIGIAQYLAIAQISTAIVMWLLQLTTFHQTSSLARLSPMGGASLIFVSLVACVFCYAILYWLLGYIDGHRLALFDALHALSATIFGYFMFREQMTALMWVGGGLILLGLIVGNLNLPGRSRLSQG